MTMTRKKSRLRKRFYIGNLKGKGYYDREIFSTSTPIDKLEDEFGHKYGYLTGPFSSKARAKKEIGEK